MTVKTLQSHMGLTLGSFSLIQFSPFGAEGEMEDERHGRGSEWKKATKEKLREEVG